MNILHLNSNLNRSKIHYNIVESLNSLDDVDGKIFFPTEKNEKNKIDKDYIDKINCLSKYEKYFYFYRNRHLLKVSSNLYKNTKFTHILAHSLFSNGKLAMDLSINLNIPYSVVVTNTDVNKYFKKMFHLRKNGETILKNASSIIFTSAAYKDRVLKQYISSDIQKEISEKSLCIPFGIETFWINNNRKFENRLNKEEIKLLYVGKINKNKNLIFLADCVQKLNKEKSEMKFKLTIIGECENSKDVKIKNNLMNREYIEIIDFSNKQDLLNYYRSADIFVMISKTESFGLVYAEAMTQGLPLIYTKNEGFDRQFEDKLVGIPVNPTSYIEIKDAVNYVIENHKKMSDNSFEQSKTFLWENVAIRFKKGLLMKKNKFLSDKKL